MKKFICIWALCTTMLVGCTESSKNNGEENGGNNGNDTASVIFPLEEQIDRFEIYYAEWQQAEPSLYYTYTITYDERGRISEMYGEAVPNENKELESERYTFRYDDAEHTAVLTSVYTDIYTNDNDKQSGTETDVEHWTFDSKWRITAIRDDDDAADTEKFSYDAQGRLLKTEYSGDRSTGNTVLEWVNGNIATITEKETYRNDDGTSSSYTYTERCEYGSAANPLADKALNVLWVFDDNMPAMAGFTGVKFRNLPSKITSDDGSYEQLSYDYDSKGRISRVHIEGRMPNGELEDYRYTVLHYSE